MHSNDELTELITRLVDGYVGWRRSLDPVPLDRSATLAELEEIMPCLINEEGNDPETVLRQYAEVIAPRVISSDSPRFLSFIPAAPTRAASAFDALVSTACLNGTSWIEAAGPIHAENQVLRFLCELIGLPDGAGGVFLSGGSAANLSALVVARETARARRPEVGRWRFAVSDQTHSSVENTMRILDVVPLVVPTDDGRLTGDALRRALEADGSPETVAAVVATAGTTNAGIIDDLLGVSEVAANEGWWFHVDGAYGAAALLVPEMQPAFAGIERADSVVIDPHKWLFAPFDCAALLYRRPSLARGVHTQDASYLDAIHENPGEWNPPDYAFHLTRKARGLPTWFSLAVHGVGAYRQAVAAGLELARSAARLIDAQDHLELVREPELSVVLFRRVGWELADYERWSADLLAREVAFVLPSKWRGEPVGRLVFLHPDTPLSAVEEILAAAK